MARNLRLLLEGGIYHITCRGNERRAIFKDDILQLCANRPLFFAILSLPRSNLTLP